MIFRHVVCVIWISIYTTGDICFFRTAHTLSLVLSLSHARAVSLMLSLTLTLSLTRIHIKTGSRSQRLAASPVYAHHTHKRTRSLPLSLLFSTHSHKHTRTVSRPRQRPESVSSWLIWAYRQHRVSVSSSLTLPPGEPSWHQKTSFTKLMRLF